MKTETVTIEIPVVKGFEIVRVGIPKTGDYIIDSNQDIFYVCNFTSVRSVRPIYKKSWEWPEWLKASYIAMDQNGDWFAYTTRPEIRGSSWNFTGPACGAMYLMNQVVLDFTPPKCSCWEDSLFTNPNINRS